MRLTTALMLGCSAAMRMPIIVRQLVQNNAAHLQITIQIGGGNTRKLLRPVGEPLSKALKRLDATLRKSAPREDSAAVPALHDADGNAIDLAVTNLEAWAKAVTLTLSGEPVRVLFEPPEVTELRLPVLPLVGVPMRALVETHNCEPSECTFVWQTAAAEHTLAAADKPPSRDHVGEHVVDWLTVGWDVEYTPTAADVGRRVRLRVQPPPPAIAAASASRDDAAAANAAATADAAAAAAATAVADATDAAAAVAEATAYSQLLSGVAEAVDVAEEPVVQRTLARRLASLRRRGETAATSTGATGSAPLAGAAAAGAAAGAADATAGAAGGDAVAGAAGGDAVAGAAAAGVTSSFRVLSYNLLADSYSRNWDTRGSVHSYCDPRHTRGARRMPRLLAEVLAYAPHVAPVRLERKTSRPAIV